MFNWDELRFFLAVTEAGSLSGAARMLEVDHATVGRRLTALEKSLESKLVDRQAHRCVLTDAGRLVLGQALEMQDLAFSIQRVLEHAQQGLSGTVSVSAPPVLVRNLLAASVVKLRAQFPNIRLALSRGPSFCLIVEATGRYRSAIIAAHRARNRRAKTWGNAILSLRVV